MKSEEKDKGGVSSLSDDADPKIPIFNFEFFIFRFSFCLLRPLGGYGPQ
jgi:hypothetical protein